MNSALALGLVLIVGQPGPVPNVPWSGGWEAVVTRANGSQIKLHFDLEISGGSRLSGTFAGGVSGTLTGRVNGSHASGRWSVSGASGGNFTMRLAAEGDELTGTWDGEQGGTVRGTYDYGARPEDCPSFAMSIVLSDFDAGIAKDCNRYEVPPSNFDRQGAYDGQLEHFIRRHPEMLGYTPQHSSIGGACRKRLEVEGKLGSIPEANRARIMSAITAEYYWSKKRLMDGVKSSLEGLATLDKLSGMVCLMDDHPSVHVFGHAKSARALADVHCAELGNTPGGPELCDRLQNKCDEEAEFGTLIDNTEISVRQAEAIRAELVRPGVTAENRALLESLLKTAEATSRWTGGKHFRERYQSQLDRCQADPPPGRSCEDLRPEFVCMGIQAEAQASRAAIHQQLMEFKNAMDCLDGTGQECDQRRFREVVAHAPPFVGLDEPDVWNEDYTVPEEAVPVVKSTLYTNLVFSQVECRQKLRGVSDAINDELKDFAVGVALTVATAGLSAAAGAARVSAGTVSAVRSANAVSKVTQLGQRSAALARFGPRVLELAALGLDLADLARGVADAVGECSDAFAQTGGLAARPSSEGQCAGSESYQGARLIEDYHDCVLRAVAVQAAFAGLPLLPAGVSKALDHRALTRARAALKGLGDLDAKKSAAVLDVFRSSFTKLKESDLAEAVGKLREAGFGDEQILRLVTELSPHLRDVGGRVLRGLRGPVIDSVEVGAHTFCVTRVAEQIVLAGCSDCEALESAFAAQLADSPELRRRLGVVKDRLLGLDPRPGAKLPRDLMQELERIGAQLGNQKRADFLLGHGLRVNNTVPRAMGPLLQLFERGRLSDAQIDAIAQATDEWIYAVKKQTRGERGAQERLTRLARGIGDLDLPPGARRDIENAFMARAKVALAEGTLFFGQSLDEVVHPKLTFPSTTPAIRADAARAKFYVDPLENTPKAFKLGARIQADHLFPVNAIVAIREFQELAPDLQRLVIHNPRNFRALPADLNQSKGGKTATEWLAQLQRDGRGPSQAFFDQLKHDQDEMERVIREQIRCLRTLGASPHCG